MKRILLSFFILFALTLSTHSEARDPNTVQLDIISSQDSLKPGETMTIAIRQSIKEGWHTYWINPGDSGEGMRIQWDAPTGVTISDLQFPTPRKIDYTPLVNYGYYDEAVFLTDITLDPNLNADSVTFTGHATWLSCEEICVPEEQTITLTLPVSENPGKTNTAFFDKARSNIPTKANWDSTLSHQDGNIVLSVMLPLHEQNQVLDVDLFPVDWGYIDNTADATTEIGDYTAIFTQKAGARSLNDLAGERTDIIVKTETSAMQLSPTLIRGAAAGVDHFDGSLVLVLVFAFLGGIILNLMPCVFPVLSMKALSLVKLSDKERRHSQASGLAYTAGIMLSFLLIAGTLIILKSAGAQIGWGFQLQDPLIVTGLATLLFVIGLNLMGVFEITGSFTAWGGQLTSGSGLKASFFTGVLATLVATPCTAPFMASAIGFALTQSAFIALLVFATLGFGLAFPYLLLCFVPAFQRIMPRPGAWMDTFKQALSFPMFASAIWLVWVVAQQAGGVAIIYLLLLALSIIFIIWWFDRIQSPLWRYGVTAILVIAFAMNISLLKPPSEKDYLHYSKAELGSLLDNTPDTPVFVNMTAAWCITCLVNERTSLSNPAVKELFNARNVAYMKGDWTNRDEAITQYLESFGRNGVPLYVYYAPADATGQRPEPVILPQILTPDIVINAITP